MSKTFEGLGNIMKQAQELQGRLADIQAEAGNKTVEGTAGGGMVTAVVNGRMEVVGLRIDKQVVEGGDVEMMQDLPRVSLEELKGTFAMMNTHVVSPFKRKVAPTLSRGPGPRAAS